jgi:pyridoxamine 5'-phosphate oxidase
MKQEIATIRTEYGPENFQTIDRRIPPLQIFAGWLADAISAKEAEPTAMTLATVGADGRPSARVVLLKHYDDEGLCFFTNYRSKKGAQIAANPQGALLFFWPNLARQVRFEGSLEKTSAQLSDEYFGQRPEGSRISAIVSPQSSAMADFSELEQRLADFQAANTAVTRPEYWGGYRLRPDLIEFWQGGAHRRHHRLEYRWINAEWQRRVLAP